MWLTSALASLTANFQNYLLNNSWTFADRSHKGFRKFEGYFSYLLVSAAGLGVATGLYAGFLRLLAHVPLAQAGSGSQILFTRLGCQLVAVLVGIWTNFALNKVLPWPEFVRRNLAATKQRSYPTLP